jgi:glycerate kinase
MRIVLAPDSFKGSLDAPAVCDALARGLAHALPDAQILARPMADGGEGTLDAILRVAGERHRAKVSGAAGDTLDAHYGLVDRPEGRTAVVEVAQVVGITDPEGMRVDVSSRSTTGVGELVAQLLDAGVRRFMVGLGGSSTNDGGSGLIAALGARLLDASGASVAATPAGLARIARVDVSRLDPRLASCDFAIMSDVNNPLTGAMGATAIFGPQKGVRQDEISTFDASLARFAALAESAFGRRVADKPAAGAAGGLGFALQLLGGNVRSGAEVVAELIGLDAALDGADWAITGEGRSDRQTLLSKAPFIVARHARARGVPVTLVSGAVDTDALPELGRHFDGCFALPNGPMTLEACIAGAAALLEARGAQIGRLAALWNNPRARP